MIRSRRGQWALLLAAATFALTAAVPANGHILFNHVAFGSGTDGLGNRLTIAATETLVGVGSGVAFVRLANEPGPTETVFLTCLIFDERPGNGFHFLYSNGTTLTGRRFYIGVFDDNGPNRPGPYDVIYTQTTPVAGPCNVAAVDSYPRGWDPVSTGGYFVE